MKTIDKVKQKLKAINAKNNLLYYICLWIMIIMFVFILITTIIQTNWVGIGGLQAPILIWMVSQPYVGVFFIPFMMLSIYICSFIVSVAKPATIAKVKADSRLLWENQLIHKPEYESIYETLDKAEIRNNEAKAAEIKATQEKIAELLQETKAKQIDKKEGK